MCLHRQALEESHAPVLIAEKASAITLRDEAAERESVRLQSCGQQARAAFRSGRHVCEIKISKERIRFGIGGVRSDRRLIPGFCDFGSTRHCAPRRRRKPQRSRWLRRRLSVLGRSTWLLLGARQAFLQQLLLLGNERAALLPRTGSKGISSRHTRLRSRPSRTADLRSATICPALVDIPHPAHIPRNSFPGARGSSVR